MVNPFDFGGHSSKVNVTMGIIDKCGVRGDATLCVVIFVSQTEMELLCGNNFSIERQMDGWTDSHGKTSIPPTT